MIHVNEYLLDLYGGDPFARVHAASNAYREEHNAVLALQDCGVYPSEAPKMRVLATLARAAGAKRVLEIGCGLGYSAFWLAEAAGPEGTVETIDRFAEHADLPPRSPPKSVWRTACRSSTEKPTPSSRP